MKDKEYLTWRKNLAIEYAKFHKIRSPARNLCQKSWKEYYNNDYTPRQAVIEDASYG